MEANQTIVPIAETKAEQKSKALSLAEVEERDRAFLEERGLSVADTQKIKHAHWLSKSQLIPAHFKNNPQDIFLALQFSERAGLDNLTVLQGIDIIHGTPSIRAKLAITMANQSNIFDGRIHYKTDGEGDKMVVTAFAKMRISGEVVTASASLAMAKIEGWYASNKKYQSMPEQMLCYRSAKFLISRYAPEILFGMPMIEEGESWEARRDKAQKVESQLSARLSAPAAQKVGIDDKR